MDNTVSVIPSMILFFVLQKGLFVLEYPSSWNQVWGQKHVPFIANQDDPQDRYLEGLISIITGMTTIICMSSNMMVKNSSLGLE